MSLYLAFLACDSNSGFPPPEGPQPSGFLWSDYPAISGSEIVYSDRCAYHRSFEGGISETSKCSYCAITYHVIFDLDRTGGKGCKVPPPEIRDESDFALNLGGSAVITTYGTGEIFRSCRNEANVPPGQVPPGPELTTTYMSLWDIELDSDMEVSGKLDDCMNLDAVEIVLDAQTSGAYYIADYEAQFHSGDSAFTRKGELRVDNQ